MRGAAWAAVRSASAAAVGGAAAFMGAAAASAAMVSVLVGLRQRGCGRQARDHGDGGEQTIFHGAARPLCRLVDTVNA
jgi:hypothetical protein